jgi:hypothetical protein
MGNLFMKHALAGLALFAAGAVSGTWWAGARAADADANANADPRASVSTAPERYALQAWEGCRPLEAGGAFTGPVTRTLALADGRSVQVSLVPATRDNGALVFDTLVRSAVGSSRSQVGFESPLLADGVLMRAVDLDGVSREVSGNAAYLHGPHPMAR